MNLNSFNQSNFNLYAAYLKSTGLSDVSIKRKLSSLSTFQKFLVKKNLVQIPSISNPIPTLSLDRARENENKNFIKKILSPALSREGFRKGFNLKNKSLFTYLLIASLLIISSAIGYGFYRQSIKNAKSGMAYSTASSPVYADRFLSFQGRLTDSAGNPITSATLIRFDLFDTETVGTGTSLYTSASGNSNTVIPDENGIFSVTIGKTHGTEIPNSVFTENPAVYLQITAATETMSPRQAIATVAYAINAETLQGLPPSASGLKNTVLTIGASGNINLGETSPSIISTSGTFGIEGQAVLIKASDSSGGNIEINPDANGIIKLTTEGSGSTDGIGLINATNASLSTGNLINASINNTSRGYNFLNFQNYNPTTTTLATRFSVDAYGNTFIGGTLSPTTISIGNTILTSSGYELNLLDGTLATAGSLIYGNGSNLVNTSVGTSGQLLMSNSTGAPFWVNSDTVGKTYTAGSGLTLSSNTFKLGGELVESTRLNIGNTEVFYAQYSTGNIGLGTTNPLQKLSVIGNGSFSTNLNVGGTLTLSQGAANNYVLSSDASGNASWQSAAGLVSTVYVPYTGATGDVNLGAYSLQATKIGIGTAPTYHLTVTDSSLPMGIQATSSSGYSGMHFLDYNGNIVGHLGYANAATSSLTDSFYFGSTASKKLYLTTADQIRMTIDTAGNVGIGTTNPSQKLDVNGKIAINGQQTIYNADALGTFSGSLYIGNGGGNLSHSSGNDGYYNTGVGLLTLFTNSTGQQNTAQGVAALEFNTSGSYNTGFGVNALVYNTAGSYNTSMGTESLFYNKAGSNGVAIGYQSQRYANDTTTAWTNTNTSVGYQALRGSTIAANNTGNYNTAIGYQTLLNNTTGIYNSAQGYSALSSNTTGGNNTAQGSFALQNNTTGLSNTAQGYATLINLTGNYSNNTALGYNAGRYYNGTTGNLTSASNSLFLGTSASALADAGTNEIVIGYNAIGNGSNSATLGNDSITKTILKGSVGIGTTNPQYKLDVSGNARFTANLYANSNFTVGSTLTLVQGAASGYLLTSDASGNASWVSAVGIGGTDTLSAGQGITITSVGVGRTIALNLASVNTWTGLQTFNATGAPFAVGSSTVVTNLNADLLDGIHRGTGTWSTAFIPTVASDGVIELGKYIDFHADNAMAYDYDVRLTTTSGTSAGTGSLAITAASISTTGNLTIGDTFVSVGSTNLVTNLNADLLDGHDTSYFLAIGSTGTLPYVNNTANGTLTRAGSGPYTLALNLGNDNTWTAIQTFNGGTSGSSAPFTVDSNYLVTNLNADLLDGLHASSFEVPLTFTNGLTRTSNDVHLGGALTENTRLNIGNTEVFYAKYSNGNVGIGTTNPTQKLDVVGSGVFTNTGGKEIIGGSNSDVQLQLGEGSGTYYYQIGRVVSSGYLSIQGNQTNANSILLAPTSGNVGIGTTNPGVKLDIAGNIRSFNSGSHTSIQQVSSGGVTWSWNTFNTNDFKLSNDAGGGTENITFLSSGNVGIGTTNPSGKLSVRTESTGENGLNISTLNGNPYTELQRWSGTSNLYYGSRIQQDDLGLTIQTVSTAAAIGSQNFNDKFRILNNGNVGIGTTTPLAPLHIGTTASASVGGQTLASLSAILTGSIAAPKYYDSDNSLYFLDPAVNDSAYSSLNLAVQGSIKFNLNGTSHINTGAATRMQSYTNGLALDVSSSTTGTVAWNNNLFLATSGYVGIGTTNPGEKLNIVKSTTWNTEGTYGLSIKDVDSNTYNTKLELGTDSTIGAGIIQTQTYNSWSTKSLLLNPNGGNVGIGTTSPGAKLDVAGQTRIYSGSTGSIVSHPTLMVNATDNPEIWLEDTGNNTGGFGIQGGTGMIFATEQAIRFKTNSTFAGGMSTGDERLTILQGGNVGIGTTNPGMKLDVSGAIRTGNGTNFATNDGGLLLFSNNAYKIGFDANGGAPYAIRYNVDLADSAHGHVFSAGPISSPTNLMTIRGDGNVGIGTTNPTGKLHINGLANSSATGLKLQGAVYTNQSFISDDTNASNRNWAFIQNGTGYGYFDLYKSTAANGDPISAGAAVLTINNTGQVGIGTASPTSKLEITGATMTTWGPTDETLIKLSRPSNVLYMWDQTASFSLNKWAADNYSDTQLNILLHNQNDGGSSAIMSLRNNGNVGIGTTAPTHKLTIAGSASTISNTSGNITITPAGGSVEVSGELKVGTGPYYAWIRLSDDDSPNGIKSVHANSNVIGFVNGAGSWIFNVSESGYGYFTGGHNDLAENYMTTGKVLRGSLVSIGTTSPWTVISSSNNHKSLVGVVSTTPGAVMDADGGFKIGSDTKSEYNNEKAPIALVGTAPTLVTLQNGSIELGDAISFSTLPGFGAKSLSAGQIVGKALQEFKPNDSICQSVNSLDEINWPENDGKNEQKPCYKLSDGTYVGKIMVAVNPSWYDPDINLTSTGQINIAYNVSDEVLASLGYDGAKNEIESATYNLTDSLGNTVTRISQFAEIAVGKIRAGLISATNIIADNIIVKNLKSKNLRADRLEADELLSPIADIDFITSRDIQSTSVTTDNLIAQDIQTTQITTDDLIANNIEADKLVADKLTASEASVSTLYADNIISKDGTFGDIMAAKISSLRDELTSIVASNVGTGSSSPESAIASQSDNWAVNITADSATIEGNLNLTDNLVIGANLMINGDTQMGNAFVTGQFNAGEITIADNYIQTMDTALYIQPNNTGSVHIMGDTLIISDTGDVRINGNLTVTGSLFANLLEASEIRTAKLTAAEINSDKINIATDSGTIIANSASADEALAQAAQINSNATAGTATLPANTNQITISTNKLTSNSMVYLTPVGSTNNQVIYVKEKTASYFVISLDNPLDHDININWWIIN